MSSPWHHSLRPLRPQFGRHQSDRLCGAGVDGVGEALGVAVARGDVWGTGRSLLAACLLWFGLKAFEDGFGVLLLGVIFSFWVLSIGFGMF